MSYLQCADRGSCFALPHFRCATCNSCVPLSPSMGPDCSPCIQARLLRVAAEMVARKGQT